MENIPLIDISFEDDLLIPSSSDEFGTHVNLEVEKIEMVTRKLEHAPKLSDSPEQKQNRFNQHLRKSLAWDSAFFTSEGILNAEELAIMNSTYCKSGFTLPRIEEELRKSSESISNLESGNRVLEKLEVNLFENVQAPIQKLGNFNHSRKMLHLEKVKGPRHSRSPGKMVVSSQLKLKPPTTSRKHVTGKQQEHTFKDPLTCMIPSYENGKSKPLIKPAKVSCKSISLPSSGPSKKTFIQKTEIKSITGAVAKQPSIVAVNKSNVTPGNTRRTNVSSISKTPMNSSIGYKEKICHPKFIKSSLTLSTVSPTCSIDTIDSDTSSVATSTSTKLGKQLEDSSIVSLSPPLPFSSGRISKNSGLLSQSCIYDRTKNNVNGDSGARLAKPSGLRMPRPTIGYFDKEKSLVQGSYKASKSSLQSTIMKNTGHVVALNKVRPIDLPSVKTKALPSELSKHALKSIEVPKVQVTPARVANIQDPSPRISMISSETATEKQSMSEKDSISHIQD